jgi:hypothetical protein
MTILPFLLTDRNVAFQLSPHRPGPLPPSLSSSPQWSATRGSPGRRYPRRIHLLGCRAPPHPHRIRVPGGQDPRSRHGACCAATATVLLPTTLMRHRHRRNPPPQLSSPPRTTTTPSRNPPTGSARSRSSSRPTSANMGLGLSVLSRRVAVMNLGSNPDTGGSSSSWRRRAMGIQHLDVGCSAFTCSAAAGCSTFTRLGEGDENSTNKVSRCSRSGPMGTDGRSGSSLPRLNSKSKNSLEIAGSAFVTAGSSSMPPRCLGRGAAG